MHIVIHLRISMRCVRVNVEVRRRCRGQLHYLADVSSPRPLLPNRGEGSHQSLFQDESLRDFVEINTEEVYLKL